jgi:hypothetical protein
VDAKGIGVKDFSFYFYLLIFIFIILLLLLLFGIALIVFHWFNLLNWRVFSREFYFIKERVVVVLWVGLVLISLYSYLSSHK